MELADELKLLANNPLFIEKFIELPIYKLNIANVPAPTKETVLGSNNLKMNIQNAENELIETVKTDSSNALLDTIAEPSAIKNIAIGMQASSLSQNEFANKIYFGSYQNPIIIFYENEQQPHLPTAEIELLDKSFSKFDIKYSDLALINLAINENKFRYYYDLLKPKKALILGIGTEKLQIKKPLIPFEPTLLGGVVFYQTPSLLSLNASKDLKLAFWKGFQRFMQF